MSSAEKIKVQLPSTGAWFWACRNSHGELTFSIYSTKALPASELDALKAASPNINFRIETTK